MNARLVGGVGIIDVVGAEDNGFRVFTLDNDTRAEADRLCKTIVPDGHAIEVRLLVELDETMLFNLFTIHAYLIINKMDGEAQGTVVQHLILTEDVGHDDAVA